MNWHIHKNLFIKAKTFKLHNFQVRSVGSWSQECFVMDKVKLKQYQGGSLPEQ